MANFHFGQFFLYRHLFIVCGGTRFHGRWQVKFWGQGYNSNVDGVIIIRWKGVALN